MYAGFTAVALWARETFTANGTLTFKHTYVCVQADDVGFVVCM